MKALLVILISFSVIGCYSSDNYSKGVVNALKTIRSQSGWPAVERMNCIHYEKAFHVKCNGVLHSEDGSKQSFVLHCPTSEDSTWKCHIMALTPPGIVVSDGENEAPERLLSL